MTREGKLYAAVHEGFMQVRIALYREPGYTDKWDAMLAQALSKTAAAVLAAYRKPLRPPRSKKGHHPVRVRA